MLLTDCVLLFVGPAGLYFGVGQGLGALIGGLLKERFGGQAMFAMCAAIILVAWLLVVAAELLTGASSSSSSSSSDCSSSVMGSEFQLNIAQKDSTPMDSLQPRQQQQQLSGSSWVQHWWQELRATLLGVHGVQGADASRRVRQAYMELGSKDSGPDLAAVRQ
jgi:hypothetical protein